MGGNKGIDQPTTEMPVPDAPETTTAAEPERRRRGVFWLVALLLVALVGGLVVVRTTTGLLDRLTNPFAEQQTDRSQPPLLESIKDLSRYVAAEGNFQVVVDTQRNRENVPDFLLNERTLFVAAGSVEAYVDFSTISEDAIVVSEDGKSATITLPAPQLGEANLDQEKSYVFSEEKGLLNRIGDMFGQDPNKQQAIYVLSEERIEAAARESELPQRAQENTTKMLEGLLKSLGYERVTVTYTAP
ncbi:DUF4230 domain-containing protein [Catenuloplanes atrovinosus]|uniref:DUF4230 domain-containing protein n=1 Tax=Catenuloplanes atrovinosus TaxID=137266 RepID=A0AAE3YW23_9ACTN|nr:DUF4230 domain-containing protein [Catenuloplanes atrovinosus]MDR7279610.1 hypothetical protein [Catenuloplanes atrovinosus]